MTQLARDPASDAVYRTQSLPLLPIVIQAHARGIRLDRAAVSAFDRDLPARYEAIERECQATIGWPIKLGSAKDRVTWLYAWQGYAKQYKRRPHRLTTDDDALNVLAKSHGDDPVVQARLRYAELKQLHSHYIMPLRGKQRAYSHFNIHSQTSGRWSTTDPPMSTLPRDGSYDHLFIPDPGECWLGYDIKAAEVWVIAAEAAPPTTLLDALRAGVDIHTENALAIFGHCPGKDSAERHFAKRFGLRLNYMGNPQDCTDIPGAAELGFVGREGQRKLAQAAKAYFDRWPELHAYQQRQAAVYAKTWTARSWDGRRRVSCARGQTAIRELVNHPFQAGVAGIFNLTTVAIAARLASMDGRFVYQAHDAAWWGVPLEHESTAKRIIEEVFAEPRRINRHEIVFKIDFKRPRYAPNS